MSLPVFVFIKRKKIAHFLVYSILHEMNNLFCLFVFVCVCLSFAFWKGHSFCFLKSKPAFIYVFVEQLAGHLFGQLSVPILILLASLNSSDAKNFKIIV